ncbi:MAG: hypothetical protein HW416_2731 [Chloroflexi bacterium]|nr:hypothetical protein [Chloroflexota bacterium]
MANAGELLDQWVNTFNEEKWEEGERLFAPNGVSEEIGTGRTFGVKEGTQVSKDWRAAFPDARGTIENRVVAGNQAVGEVIWTGTNRGSMNGMPPTNKSVRVRAAVVLTEEAGKIVKVRHYIDVAGMLTQLGVMPPPPGR